MILNIPNRFVFIFLVLISGLFSQNSLLSPAQPYIKSGISNLYNYHFDLALTSLDSAVLIDPIHPVQPFVRLAVKWLKAQTEHGYEASYSVIEEEVNTLVPWYDSMVKKYPNDPEYPLYLGSTYGMKARIALAKRHWLDVIIFGYQGYKYVNIAREIDPELPDIQMPIGLMEYYSSKMPGSIQWIAGLFGIHADTRFGLEKLEIAASTSQYSWIESSNVLVYAYLYMEKDYENALKWVRPLTEEFPDNPMFKLLMAEALAKSYKWNELDQMLPGLKRFTAQGSDLLRNECQLKYLHILALKAFEKSDYQTVIELTTEMIDHYKMEFDWLLGFAHLLRGKAIELSGDRQAAIKDYQATASMDNKYPEVEEAKKLIRIPISGK
ncbi:MAG: tetratricopeptide repeat protein [Fidelibacterota bacterium]